MDLLLQKYNDYMRLVGCKVKYELIDGTVIEVVYREENFLHLLGLHKVVDIQLIQFWLDRTNRTVKLMDVIKGIKNGTLTDAIVDFNASLIHSKISSDYILFEEKKKGEYNHMGIAKDAVSGSRYVETFFHESSDKYIAGQKTVKVKSYKVYDISGNVLFEDSF